MEKKIGKLKSAQIGTWKLSINRTVNKYTDLTTIVTQERLQYWLLENLVYRPFHLAWAGQTPKSY